MNLITYSENIKAMRCLIIAYDVAKYKHNYFTSFKNGNERLESEGVINSSTTAIKKHLAEIREIAEQHNFNMIRIVCEPTGGYEKKLLNLARCSGFFTEYVNGEATSKYKVIETNDSGKNDIKDARIIFSLAKQGKTLTCKEQEGLYAHLSFLNSKYEDVSLDLARVKNYFSSTVDAFFPDLKLTSDQLHSKICRSVIEVYSLNSHEIAQLKWNTFKNKITKEYGRKISGSTEALLKKIWDRACSNALEMTPQWKIDEHKLLIRDYFARMVELEKKKEAYRCKMTALFNETEECSKLKEAPISIFILARIVAETGPLDNFDIQQKLMKYSGLNLKENSSGTYKGRVRISKKGNSLLRKVLGQIVFTFFSRRGTLYGDYYHEKKAKRGSIYGLTCVMRKVLKMIFGVYKSKEAFCLERVRSEKSALLQKAS